MTDTPAGYSSVTADDGVTITSNTENTEQITETLKPEAAPEPEAEPEKERDPKLSKAASKLGKAGGEAAAAKRAEAKAAEEAEAEGGTSEEDDIAAAEQAEKEGKLGKPRHDAKARMLQKAREAKSLKAEVERERTARQALERRLAEGTAPQKPKAAEATTDAPAKPKAEDFDNYEDFVEARARFAANEEWEKREKASQEQAQFTARDNSIREAVTTFQSRFEEAAKADPAFTDKTRDLAGFLRPSFLLGKGEPRDQFTAIADEIITSEQAPALMLHLSEHRDDLQRIASLGSPRAIAREMAKLEERLGAAPTSAPAPRGEVSKARPPIRPVAGTPYTADQVPGEEASYEDHKRYWNKQDRAARR